MFYNEKVLKKEINRISETLKNIFFKIEKKKLKESHSHCNDEIQLELSARIQQQHKFPQKPCKKLSDDGAH